MSIFWIQDTVGRTIWCTLGLVFYSLYLVVDTMLLFRDIDGSGRHGGVTIGYGDAILGAMLLYSDIVMIFLYLLAIFGGGN